MPRLRAVRTKEEAAAVPEDQAIAVLITEGEEQEELKTSSKKLQDVAGDTQPTEEEIKAVQAAAGGKEPPKGPPEPPEIDEEKEELKKRLAALEASGKTASELAEQRRRELEKLARDRQAEQIQFATGQLNTQIEMATNALATAQAESEAAQRDWEAAVAEGDVKKQSEANVRINRSQARIVQYEDYKANLEAQAAQAAEYAKQAPQQQQQVDPIERAIAGLPDSAKTWLRTHTEYLTDPEKNTEIQYLHHKAVKAGNAPFSPGYFEWVETQLGMRKPSKKQEIDEDDDGGGSPPAARERSIVSAPVTREAPSLRDGRPVTRRITLSPAQREAARVAGITEIEYAKQLLRLEEAKKNGSIQ